MLPRPEPGQTVEEFRDRFDPKSHGIDLDDWYDHCDALIEEEELAYEAVRKTERLAQLLPPDPPKKETLHTKMGTPCSPLWDQDWIEQVDKTEAETGHRCCGARVNEIFPCELKASNKNGRCRFHGGGLGSGAQKGNMNARIHGLYSRRLQQCGQHCPHWNTCPYAGEDVKSLPENRRPACFFEQQELSALRKLDAAAHENYIPLKDRSLKEIEEKPYPMHAQLISLRENLHMLQIMITRAANALSIQKLTTETVQQTENYYAKHEKPSALLQAHQMLAREHRLTLTLYNTFIKQWGLPKYEIA